MGWPDTFARPEFAQRQRAYQSAMRLRNIYTPQVVIGGHRQLSGAADHRAQHQRDDGDREAAAGRGETIHHEISVLIRPYG